MDSLDRIWHLLGLIAPALWVALLSASAWALLNAREGGLGWPKWRWMVAAGALAGGVALVGGLWWLGRDGKMVTYVALCVAVAAAQWAVLQFKSP